MIECKSLQDFISSIKTHKCTQNPRIVNWNRKEFPSIFKIGFRCLDCREVWCLGLSSLKKSTKDLPDRGLSLFKEYNEIARMKNGQIFCDKFISSLLNDF